MGIDGHIVSIKSMTPILFLTAHRLYTFSVYIGSSIYTPSEQGIMDRFGVSPTAAALGMSLYVLACWFFPLAIAE